MSRSIARSFVARCRERGTGVDRHRVVGGECPSLLAHVVTWRRVGRRGEPQSALLAQERRLSNGLAARPGITRRAVSRVNGGEARKRKVEKLLGKLERSSEMVHTRTCRQKGGL